MGGKEGRDGGQFGETDWGESCGVVEVFVAEFTGQCLSASMEAREGLGGRCERYVGQMRAMTCSGIDVYVQFDEQAMT